MYIEAAIKQHVKKTKTSAKRKAVHFAVEENITSTNENFTNMTLSEDSDNSSHESDTSDE